MDSSSTAEATTLSSGQRRSSVAFPRYRTPLTQVPGRHAACTCSRRGAYAGETAFASRDSEAPGYRAPQGNRAVRARLSASASRSAALTMGELCHFLGREFVCGIFTWPAGGDRGILFGYDVDRESAEYAVEDLVKLIRIIAADAGPREDPLRRPQPRHRHARIGARRLERGGLCPARAPPRASFTSATSCSSLPTSTATSPSPRSSRFFPTRTCLSAANPNPARSFRRHRASSSRMYVSRDDKALATSGWLFGSIATARAHRRDDVHA